MQGESNLTPLLRLLSLSLNYTLWFYTTQECVISAGPHPDSRHNHSRCRSKQAPVHCSLLLFPQGLKTKQRNQQPPACFTACTTLSITCYPFSSSLRPPCPSLTSLYITATCSLPSPSHSFPHLFHPRCPCIVAIVVISHVCYMVAFSKALRIRTPCLCVAFHTGLSITARVLTSPANRPSIQ